jgi:hypothetical protein
MTHRIARSTRDGGRPTSGEGDSAPPVRQCLDSSLEKLHNLSESCPGARVRLGVVRKDWSRRPCLGSDGGRWRSLSTANSGDLRLGQGFGCASAYD